MVTAHKPKQKNRLQTQKNGRNWNLENVGFGVHKYLHTCFAKNYWIKENKIRLYQDKDQIHSFELTGTKMK